MSGLTPDTLFDIKTVFAKLPQIDKVILYGSRAKGNYRKGSDIDITLIGKNLNLKNSVYPLIDKLDELYLPYTFDISILKHIDNQNLIEHINKVGKVFYKKEKCLPDGWVVKRLGEVCEVLDKFRKPITKRDRIEGDYPYYGATGILSYVHQYIFNENLVLVGEDGAKWASGDRTSFIANGKYWVNNHAHVLRPNRKILLDEWIVYFLNFSDLSIYITGLTVPKLNQEKMKSIQILIPPLAEQKRIVSILDKAFTEITKAKTNAEQNLKNTKELFKSYLQDVFDNKGDDWEVKTLNQISENLDSKRIPITKSNRKSGGIPYYGASGIVDYVDGYIFDEDLLCVSEDGANLLARTYPIAFSISGKTWVNNHAHILKFSNLTIQKFIEIYLNSIKLDDYIGGMAQPKLNQKQLNKIPIPLPPIQIQKHIVKKLDALQNQTKKLETIYQQKTAILDELKKSVLEKAFNGELV